MIRAYRTVSAKVALLLSDTPPGDLLALEKSRVRKRNDEVDGTDSPATIRKSEREITINGWQNHWKKGSNSTWTRSILPNIRRWINRPHKDLSFHMTQALSGHGCFRHYLHRMGRAPDAGCLYCGHPQDTVEHTLLLCPHWGPHRIRLIKFVGRRELRATDIANFMCGPENLPNREDNPNVHDRITQASNRARDAFYQMLESILNEKEEDERRREAAARLN